VGASPTRQSLQPEAIGTVEVARAIGADPLLDGLASMRTSPNRRIRTRMSDGVGGVTLRGVHLSRGDQFPTRRCIATRLSAAAAALVAGSTQT
jgi:hypothetical protein